MRERRRCCSAWRTPRALRRPAPPRGALSGPPWPPTPSRSWRRAAAAPRRDEAPRRLQRAAATARGVLQRLGRGRGQRAAARRTHRAGRRARRGARRSFVRGAPAPAGAGPRGAPAPAGAGPRGCETRRTARARARAAARRPRTCARTRRASRAGTRDHRARAGTAPPRVAAQWLKLQAAPAPATSGSASRATRPRSTPARSALCSAALPPPPRTKWTRRVPHPVLIGHAVSLTPY